MALVIALGLSAAARGAETETWCSGGSGKLRADLRTGEVRTAATPETLTYSTEWCGGDTVVVAVNGIPLGDPMTGSGTIVWTPPEAAGTYELTHMVVTGGVEVVLRAWFRTAETLCSGGSGKLRADLRTGEVRTMATPETLTYSTEWYGGEVATIAANGEQVFQGAGSGTYLWTPWEEGTNVLTHTVVSNGYPVVELARFLVLACSEMASWRIGATAADTVVAWTNGTGTLVIRGLGAMCDFAADGTDIPWPLAEITAVDIAGGVTNIGLNAWYGLGDGVTYNGLSGMAAKTLINGFGGSVGYVRTAYRDFQIGDGVVRLEVAMETAPSLTNEWSEVKLDPDNVTVDANGHITIEHATGEQSQGFYSVQPTK